MQEPLPRLKAVVAATIPEEEKCIISEIIMFVEDSIEERDVVVLSDCQLTETSGFGFDDEEDVEPEAEKDDEFED